MLEVFDWDYLCVFGVERWDGELGDTCDEEADFWGVWQEADFEYGDWLWHELLCAVQSADSIDQDANSRTQTNKILQPPKRRHQHPRNLPANPPLLPITLIPSPPGKPPPLPLIALPTRSHPQPFQLLPIKRQNEQNEMADKTAKMAQALTSALLSRAMRAC